MEDAQPDVRRFVRFTEVNEWEGETWNFWLLYNGNEDELTKFRTLLETAEDEDETHDFPYQLELLVRVAENEVDALVRYGNDTETYYPTHSKVEGVFTCPDVYDHSQLYKGDIVKLFAGSDN